MEKKDALYKYFLYGIVIASIAILFATGVIAITKHFKANLHVDIYPEVQVEFWVKNETLDEVLLFRNFENTDTGDKVEFNSDYCFLKANKLQLTNNFAETYGNSFSLIIKNFTDCNIKATINLSSSNGQEEVQITPNQAEIGTGASKEFEIECNVIFTKQLEFDIMLEQFVNLDMPIYQYNQTNISNNFNVNFEGYYYIEMGEYPQSYKTDSSIRIYSTETMVTDITTSTTESGTIGYGNDGKRYYYQKNDEVSNFGITGWYKFEPIRWLIIGAGSGLASQFMFNDAPTTAYSAKVNGKTGSNKELAANQLLLISEQSLFRQMYDVENSTNQFGSANCELQVALNGAFAELSGLKQHFEGIKQSGNVIETVSPKTTFYYHDGENGYGTYDETSEYNIFVLGCSNGVFKNDNYKVTDYLLKNSKQIASKPTDFAKATGAQYASHYENAGYWWLRSGNVGFTTGYFAHVVDYNGGIGGYPSSGGWPAARPSFVLTIK